MNDDGFREVQPTSYLIDAYVKQPQNGARVLALTCGGVLTSTVWTSKSLGDFVAWSAYPKVPRSVKERMLNQLGVKNEN